MSAHRVPPLFLSLLLLVLTGAVPLSAQSADAGTGPAPQAEAFLAKARQAIAAGSAAQAASLIASALQLFPGYSEALYLKGRLESADRSSTMLALADLDQAVGSSTWTVTDPDEARQELAGLLLRTGQVQRAVALLRPLVEAHPENEAAAALLARAYARAGDDRAEQAVLSQAQALFPLAEDLTILQAGLQERQGRRAAARSSIAAALRARPDNLPLLLAAARLAPDAKDRLTAVEAYAQKGGKDPLAAVIALESSPPSSTKYVTLFLDDGGLGHQDLTTRVAAAVGRSGAAASALQNALGGFSGNRDLDQDGDGFWEERWTFSNGSPVEWIRDTAEDGVPDYTAEFTGGRVASLSYRPEAGTTTSVQYSRYPFVETAREAGPAGITVYYLKPYTLQAAFLQTIPTSPIKGVAPVISARIRLPSVAQILAAAYRSEDLGADGATRIRATSIDHGRRVYLEEDTNGDGLMDHRVWFQDGQPVRGERSLDGGVTFPIGETWRAGILVSEAIDTNGDGKIDFRQSFAPRPSKSWDYNEDGMDDSRETPGPEGTDVLEFSTALNGVFDVRLVFLGPKLVRASISGATIGITEDPARGVTWIGPPAPASVSVEGLDDGIHVLSDTRFLSFSYGGIHYMEEIR
ncbi:MAG TPA: hypothetical protein VFH83_09175 [Spirochaetia bacterium]|nr:hypothetical protein [Spirochaetia bacterium]